MGGERFSRTLAYNDATGLQTNLVILNLQEGDYLDFALDSKGTDGSLDDSCDGCTFSVVIEQAPSDGPDWNSNATASRSALETSVAEEIDLASVRGLLKAGTNVLAIHGLNTAPADRDFLLLPEMVGTKPGMDPGKHAYFTTPTPGSANGAGSLTIGPIVSDVGHAPMVPGDNDDLVVHALVTPSLRPVKSVTLKYRAMYSTEVTATMYDDGSHDDGAAGDNVYGARIPASASTPGQMVRYYIVATDMNSQAARAPAFSSPTRSPQYFGTVVFDPVLDQLPPAGVALGSFKSPSAADSDAIARLLRSSSNGVFYDNIGASHSTGCRRVAFPKRAMTSIFNPGYKFRWSEAAPRVGDHEPADHSGRIRHSCATSWPMKTYRDAGAPAHFALPGTACSKTGTFTAPVANIVECGD
jgi:hypothetical protein